MKTRYQEENKRDGNTGCLHAGATGSRPFRERDVPWAGISNATFYNRKRKSALKAGFGYKVAPNGPVFLQLRKVVLRQVELITKA